MFSAHQPGSKPLVIPESVPNPATEPRPTRPPEPVRKIPVPTEPVKIPEKVH